MMRRTVLLVAALLAPACDENPEKPQRERPVRLWQGAALLLTHRTGVKPLAAKNVDFSKYPPKSKPANLRVPVDWNQDPHRDRSWRARLHGWQWIWPLLADYHEHRDKRSFTSALRIAKDWLRQHPLGKRGLGEFTWGDTQVGFRAEALGYLLRAGVEADLVDGPTQQLLLESAIQHGERLANDRYYTERHNHGLFQDHSLAVLCAQLEKLPQCEQWRAKALQRFRENLKGSLEPESFMHLEHSPWYHYYVIPLVRKMGELTKDRELLELHDRLERVAAWLVPPDHHFAIVGDTGYKKLPKWAIRAAAKLEGMAPVQQAGYGIVKQADSYLLAFAGHHSKVHKHADDGTFVWYELGQPIITDTGMYAYRHNAQRQFALSTRAHNTLMVDGKDFPLEKPYGSGIRASGSGERWFAIMAENPHVKRQGVQHHRTWLYRPAEWLFVIDHVEAAKAHRYDRYLHFWHELEVSVDRMGRWTTKLAETTLYGADLSPRKDVKPQLIRDQKDPLQGVMYPYGTKARPNDVLELSASAQSALFVVGFRVGKPLPPAELAKVTQLDDGYRLRLPGESIEVTYDQKGKDLKIARR